MPVTLARRKIIRPRSPFAFPGSNPGFDPSHPAAGGMSAGHGISCVAAGNTFVNLLSGKPGTFAGASTANINGAIGPAVLRSGIVTDRITFAGNSTANETLLTYGAIVVWTSNAQDQPIISATAGGNNGPGTMYITGGVLSSYAVTGAYGSGIALTSGVPYFLGVSHSPTASNQVALRLDNGLLKTATPTSSLNSTPAASNGTYVVISDQYLRTGIITLSAAMLSFSFMSLPQLVAWAQDPWSFWYPRK